MLPGLHRLGERRDLVQPLAVQCVVDPTSLAPIGHEARIAQRLQVERQARLRRVEAVLQLADAPLTVGQHFDDLQSCLIGQRMKPARRPGQCGEGRRRHARQYINKTRYVYSTRSVAGLGRSPRNSTHFFLAQG